tara:strand:- start:3 stop:455 length:453 start_codon:yes stop_codon:yes gene_type:complete
MSYDSSIPKNYKIIETENTSTQNISNSSTEIIGSKIDYNFSMGNFVVYKFSFYMDCDGSYTASIFKLQTSTDDSNWSHITGYSLLIGDDRTSENQKTNVNIFFVVPVSSISRYLRIVGYSKTAATSFTLFQSSFESTPRYINSILEVFTI